MSKLDPSKPLPEDTRNFLDKFIGGLFGGYAKPNNYTMYNTPDDKGLVHKASPPPSHPKPYDPAVDPDLRADSKEAHDYLAAQKAAKASRPDFYGRPPAPKEKDKGPEPNLLYGENYGNYGAQYDSSGSPTHKNSYASPKPHLSLGDILTIVGALAFLSVCISAGGFTVHAMRNGGDTPNYVVNEITAEEAYAMSTQEASRPAMVVPTQAPQVAEVSANIIIPVPERDKPKPVASTFNPRKFQPTFELIVGGIVVFLGCVAAWAVFRK